jgi:molecular chaperone GrpE (heat shock protein)
LMPVVSLSNQWQNRLDEGQIIGEVQRGYELGDRVLRPALVRVAKGKPVSEAEESDSY